MKKIPKHTSPPCCWQGKHVIYKRGGVCQKSPKCVIDKGVRVSTTSPGFFYTKRDNMMKMVSLTRWGGQQQGVVKENLSNHCISPPGKPLVHNLRMLLSRRVGEWNFTGVIFGIFPNKLQLKCGTFFIGCDYSGFGKANIPWFWPVLII